MSLLQIECLSQNALRLDRPFATLSHNGIVHFTVFIRKIIKLIAMHRVRVNIQYLGLIFSLVSLAFTLGKGLDKSRSKVK